MSTYPHLENAPIVEALIDIQVNPRPELDIAEMRRFRESVKEDYPKEQEQRALHISLSLGQSRKTTQTDEPSGFRYESADGLQVVQARLDGFTFSRLKEYETWDKLRDEACRLWQMYEEISKPTSIKRVAVRFINQMNLGLPLNEYLCAPPVVPPGMSNDLRSFLTRTVIYDDSVDASVIITQALKGIEEKGRVPIILDIDVFKVTTTEVNSDMAWMIIDSFHDIKNKIFFKSITRKTREIYE